MSIDDEMNFIEHLIDRDHYDNLAGIPLEGRTCYVPEETAVRHKGNLIGYNLLTYNSERYDVVKTLRTDNDRLRNRLADSQKAYALDGWQQALDKIERLKNDIIDLTDGLEQATMEIEALKDELEDANDTLGGIH